MYTFSNIAHLQNDLRAGNVTCQNLVQDFLVRIKEKKHLNIYLETFDNSALAQAKKVDEKIKAGTQGALAGVVLALKDNICYKGHRVSASSKILEHFTSLYSATVVERLLAQDAIIIGRTNCDEFAMGSSNENSAYGPVLNPVNEKTVPGGSSGGSAAAVAAHLCHAALGSDTGGSIRQPASFCGVVGLKPTYGRVSRWGLLAYASSFDQIGPLTHSVEDAALIMEIISGKDEHDSTSSSKKVDAYSSDINIQNKKLKIAYIKDCLDNPSLDAEIKTGIEHIIHKLQQQGHVVEGVDFKELDYLVPTYYVLTTAEASSNLSRYGGVPYGYRSAQASDLESMYKKTRSEGFGKEVQRRIMLGTFVLSAGYYDAYYGKAQQVRRVVRDKTNAILKNYDLILTPATPATAFEHGTKGADPIKMYLEDIYTVQANIAGIPAISIPAGLTKNKMPFGLQLMAQPFAEHFLLAASKYVETLL
ncbi:MAG: Asp-tRNA(Asn)/Glu-tRNA(Gln) amidotransferase subunit GatA [Bacteroidetes bacterium]|nr:Asp-tRNA(Asn)/Glu-tRNA(Gln) amidotransferase subunit GatA [Bacteroidota bacterium]